VTLDRGFVPRAGRRVTRAVWGWDVALAGWTRTATDLVATRAAALEDPQRAALVKTARRLAKRISPCRVAAGRGPVRTARPNGTRMGKGKGKPAGHRGWTPRGVTLFEGGRVPGWSVLTGRSAARVTRRVRFY
jgi:ribosomal protein L16/L10AE